MRKLQNYKITRYHRFAWLWHCICCLHLDSIPVAAICDITWRMVRDHWVRNGGGHLVSLQSTLCPVLFSTSTVCPSVVSSAGMAHLRFVLYLNGNVIHSHSFDFNDYLIDSELSVDIQVVRAISPFCYSACARMWVSRAFMSCSYGTASIICSVDSNYMVWTALWAPSQRMASWNTMSLQCGAWTVCRNAMKWLSSESLCWAFYRRFSSFAFRICTGCDIPSCYPSSSWRMLSTVFVCQCPSIWSIPTIQLIACYHCLCTMYQVHSDYLHRASYRSSWGTRTSYIGTTGCTHGGTTIFRQRFVGHKFRRILRVDGHFPILFPVDIECPHSITARPGFDASTRSLWNCPPAVLCPAVCHELNGWSMWYVSSYRISC